MRGLFEKDLALLLQRKSSILVMLAIGIMMGITVDATYAAGYISMLASILSVGTIAYDEFENGHLFLMTLPITRAIYVRSKYLLSLIVSTFGWVFASIVCIIINLTQGFSMTGEDYLGLFSLWLLAQVIAAIMISLRLKFGTEGSRLVMALFAGSIIIAVTLGSKILPSGVQLPIHLSETSILAFAGGAILAVYLISYRVSVRVMNRKQF